MSFVYTPYVFMARNVTNPFHEIPLKFTQEGWLGNNSIRISDADSLARLRERYDQGSYMTAIVDAYGGNSGSHTCRETLLSAIRRVKNARFCAGIPETSTAALYGFIKYRPDYNHKFSKENLDRFINAFANVKQILLKEVDGDLYVYFNYLGDNSLYGLSALLFCMRNDILLDCIKSSSPGNMWKNLMYKFLNESAETGNSSNPPLFLSIYCWQQSRAKVYGETSGFNGPCNLIRNTTSVSELIKFIKEIYIPGGYHEKKLAYSTTLEIGTEFKDGFDFLVSKLKPRVKKVKTVSVIPPLPEGV